MKRAAPKDLIGTRDPSGVKLLLGGFTRTTQLLFGKKSLLAFAPQINELRSRTGQQDDLTVEPRYFIAANTQKNRRCIAVLIRRGDDLEACVFFYEHCRYGLGLGLIRGGDYVGQSLVVGVEDLRLCYVYLASRALSAHWRIHGVSLTLRAAVGDFARVFERKSSMRFLQKSTGHRLALNDTYQSMLSAFGPRTRRSLAAKRHKLESNVQPSFIPALTPKEALAAMLSLQERSKPRRITRYFRARYDILCDYADFFSMGLRLADGAWLSVLSGWRRAEVTYIDLQMNDLNYKRESISAVMRAFMLEHEILAGQKIIDFVGGTSVLLGRYCHPIEECIDVFQWRPGIAAKLFASFPSSAEFRLVRGAGLEETGIRDLEHYAFTTSDQSHTTAVTASRKRAPTRSPLGSVEPPFMNPKPHR